MKIKKGLEEEYRNYVELNANNGYSKAITDATEVLGNALDEGKTCEEAEDIACKDAGLTGFMAGCMARAIAYYHPRGKEFKKYWNAQFGVKKAKGVVNPAILTIGR